MNPIDWFAWLYGKVFHGHAFIGGTIIAALWALLGLALWVRGVDKYNDEHSTPSEATRKELGNLKARTILLSQEILQFLAIRQRNEPLLTPDQGNDQVHRSIQYGMDTMAMYSQQFAGRVIAIHDELATHGYRNPEVDKYCKGPIPNMIVAQIVAQNLRALAEEIKQD